MNTSTKETKLLHEVKAAVLHVRDLPRMAAWYAKLLGMPLKLWTTKNRFTSLT